MSMILPKHSNNPTTSVNYQSKFMCSEELPSRLLLYSPSISFFRFFELMNSKKTDIRLLVNWARTESNKVFLGYMARPFSKN